jgi:hypothetical protein
MVDIIVTYVLPKSFISSNDLTIGLLHVELHIEQRQPRNLLGKTCHTPANLHKMKIDKSSPWENMTHASQSPQDRVEESTASYLLIQRPVGLLKYTLAAV